MADEKLTKQEEVVKAYLDAQVVNDTALRTLYVPSKIKDCFKYITSEAKKQAKNGCAMVEDAVVFKWARDYYLEVLPKEATNTETKVVVGNVSTETQSVLENADKVLKQTKEVTVITGDPKYDENGNGLLFDF